ncbi:MAG: hypothetical protein U5O39_13765 [Gammaproteobacteria bacterium]|nr:hypothetical protein [Gammaproteobacteria bacterium]
MKRQIALGRHFDRKGRSVALRHRDLEVSLGLAQCLEFVFVRFDVGKNGTRGSKLAV